MIILIKIHPVVEVEYVWVLSGRLTKRLNFFYQIKDAVRKTDSQASEVDVTFFMFDSGKVVNSSYVVSVMNRLSTSQMTSLTRPYAVRFTYIAQTS